MHEPTRRRRWKAPSCASHLRREWRRPGWTTPAEFLLVSTILDSMAAHVDALAGMKAGLIKGSRAVTGG